MKALTALAGGLTGACLLTLMHETIKRADPDAPRMDLLGMEALSKVLRGADQDVPPRKTLFAMTMAGDIVSNALYYSLAGAGHTGQLEKGTLLGLAAGAGAVLLPGPLGLEKAPSNRTVRTKLLTVAIYLAGGIAAGAAMKRFAKL